MRTRRIREEKPRPKRRRDRDDPPAMTPLPVDAAQRARGKELLTRLRSERDEIDRALAKW